FIGAGLLWPAGPHRLRRRQACGGGLLRLSAGGGRRPGRQRYYHLPGLHRHRPQPERREGRGGEIPRRSHQQGCGAGGLGAAGAANHCPAPARDGSCGPGCPPRTAPAKPLPHSALSHHAPARPQR
ncbi:unnamed protein product, partial [Effrenium voratum]